MENDDIEEVSSEGLVKDHHWEGLIPDPEKFFGFIYVIEETSTGKRYVGKKSYMLTKRVKVPHRKNRKIVKTPNNWKYYTGSCKPLNERISEETVHDFTFTIISQFETKGDLYYEEILEQVMRDVMRARSEDGEKKYYNGNINGIKFLPPCKGSEHLKDRLDDNDGGVKPNDSTKEMALDQGC